MLVLTIIGGGASGLMAAISAGHVLKGAEPITIIEKNDRIGKKLLATGSGRCNITNINADKVDYYGNSPDFVKNAFSSFGPVRTLDFFSQLGLVCYEEEQGRVYPRCNSATAVLDVMRNEAEHLNINIIHANALNLSRGNGLYIIKCEDRVIEASRVIVAAGGEAAPNTGSDGSGVRLLKQLGHRIIKTYPALVQIRLETPLKALNGLRVYAGLELLRQGSVISREAGEVQFTNYGLSGIPALDLSGRVGDADGMAVDFAPEYDYDVLVKMLDKRAGSLGYLPTEQFFTGIFQRMIGQTILKRAGIERGLPVASLDSGRIRKLARCLKQYDLRLSGTLGFREAQVTGGGADTTQFNPQTMESTLRRGLYAAGEELDVYGLCGGYNLQWAWASGYAAGRSAAVKGH